MEIKILGSGCPNCIKLEKSVREAVQNMGIEADIEKVTEIKDIMSYGVMSTPAIVVDGIVKSTGRVLNAKQVEQILK